MDFKRMSELLKEQGKTQKEMCKEIGILEPSLSNVKNGTKKAGIEMVLKIAKYLKVNPIEISPESADLLEFAISDFKVIKSENKTETGARFLDNADVHKLLEDNSNLIYSNKELVLTNKEATIALVDLTKHIVSMSLIIQKDNNYSKE